MAQALALTGVTDSGALTSQLSLHTFYGLLRLLTACVTASPGVAEELLRARLSSTLRNLLARYQCSALLASRPVLSVMLTALALHSKAARKAGGIQFGVHAAVPALAPWTSLCSSQRPCTGADLFVGCCSSPLFALSTASPSSVLRSVDQLLDVMTLACELLPTGQDAGSSAAARDPAASLSEATISSPGALSRIDSPLLHPCLTHLCQVRREAGPEEQ